MAPGLRGAADARPRRARRSGDFDFYEIHEAFASQVLATLAAWEDAEFCTERLGLDAPLGAIDRDKLNVNGSSLAAGHPFAATGGRIVATAGQDARREGLGTRADLDLRRGRPGRRGDRRALISGRRSLPAPAGCGRSTGRSPVRWRRGSGAGGRGAVLAAARSPLVRRWAQRIAGRSTRNQLSVAAGSVIARTASSSRVSESCGQWPVMRRPTITGKWKR